MSETFGVRGRVLGEDGQPLAGARVFSDRRSAETDADGRFAFESLERGAIHSISARAGDCYAPTITVETEEELELRMRRGTTLVARVLADGEPLAGATVAFGREIRAVTDEHGIATICGMPPIINTGHVFAEGRATHRLEMPFDRERMLQQLDREGDVIERTFELGHGAEVSGRVVDQSGALLSDVLLVATGPTEELGVQTRPHPDGSWKVTLGAGRYQIQATWGPRRMSQTLTIECDGRTPQRDLVLRVGSSLENARFGRISGIVVDEEGRPAAGAYVHVYQPKVLMYDWAGRTDADGRFESREIGAVDEVEVTASWRSMMKDVIHRARPGAQGLRLELPTGATFVGRVLLDGAPVPYFGVRLILAPGRYALPRTFPRSSAESGEPIGVRSEDGRFVLPHVPAGTRRLSVIAPGTRLAVTDEIAVTGGETIDLGDIVLERGDRISGVVRDRMGLAVENACVFVGRIAFTQLRPPLENLFHGRYEARTDILGAYVLEGVDIDRSDELPEVVQATHPVAGLSVIREIPFGDTTLDFELLGRGRIEGTIRNLRTVPNVVRADEPMGARFATSHEGHFEIEVPPGDYVIKGSEDSPSARVTVLDGQTVRVDMDAKGT